MTFNGGWELQSSKQLYDFDGAKKTLTIIADGTDEASAASTYQFTVDEKKKTISWKEATATNAGTTYTIVTRSDTKLTLKRVPQPDDDSMEEEVLVLVPAGYPGGVGEDPQDDDGNDSGVDMGLDLCIVGTKITKK